MRFCLEEILGWGFVGKKSLCRGEEHIEEWGPCERRKGVFLRFLAAAKKT